MYGYVIFHQYNGGDMAYKRLEIIWECPTVCLFFSWLRISGRIMCIIYG